MFTYINLNLNLNLDLDIWINRSRRLYAIKLDFGQPNFLWPIGVTWPISHLVNFFIWPVWDGQRRLKSIISFASWHAWCCLLQAHYVPVVLVENSSRCNKNDSEEKVSRFCYHALLGQDICLNFTWSKLCFVLDSSKWNCLDSQDSRDDHKSCYQWKQKHFGWPKVDWWSRC